MNIRMVMPLFVVLLVAVSCGNPQEVKNTTGSVSTVASATVVAASSAAPVYDRMKDVSYSNAVAYLQESMVKENAKPEAVNRMNTGKAFFLLLQVLKERYTQFGEAGFEKIGFSLKEFDNYKNVSRMKLTDVLGDPKADPDTKAEAKMRLDQLESLSLK